MDEIAQQAINEALSGNWQKAYELNGLILKSSPQDVDAMVRSAKALMELGELTKAKKILESALKIDRFNNIAARLLLKIKSVKNGGEVVHNKTSFEKFIEEPGKTKLTELTNLGDPNILIQVDPGDEVKLTSHGKTISVNTINDKHLGRLPESLGFKIKKLISQGFEFKALIKSATPESVRVFIREISKPTGFATFITFPAEREEIIEEAGKDADEEY